MSGREKPRDGFLTKVIVATIVVIWVSLVGGNWLGHYVVEEGYIGNEAEAVEFKAMPTPRPRPWVSVDPQIQEQLEKHVQKQEQTEGKAEPEKPVAVVTASPVPQKDKADKLIPIEEPEKEVAPEEKGSTPGPEPTPADSSDAPEPAPTPEALAVQDASYRLQFGSFGNLENARRLAQQLTDAGQAADVEEIDTGNGKVYRVRGGAFTKEADAQGQADNLREKGLEAFIVGP